MNLEALKARSGAVCELCGAKNNLSVFELNATPTGQQNQILVCERCSAEIHSSDRLDADHWRCLNNSMWSEVPAVQVMSYRLLQRLQQQGESWATDLLDTMYLDDDMLSWAKAGAAETKDADEKIIHKDSNGNILQNGDAVVLIKDLDVKGGGFTAKRGTAVKAIMLVEDNAAQIEGKINGQQIVILTQYVKKV